MQKKFFIFFLLIPFFYITLKAAEKPQDIDFITPLEYGEMLYINPRGIPCASCHGIKGEGKEIAHYRANNQAKVLKAPQINNMDFKNFLETFNKPLQVMPRYHLTQDEILAIYNYLLKKE